MQTLINNTVEGMTGFNSLSFATIVGFVPSNSPASIERNEARDSKLGFKVSSLVSKGVF